MSAPTDTLHVQVKDLRYPVTEDVIRNVFGPIAQPSAIRILSSNDKGTAVAIVRFADSKAAEECRQQRDNRCIYSECNRMQIAFTSWESFFPGAILASPPMVSGPYSPFVAPDGFAPGGVERGRSRGRSRGGNLFPHPSLYPQNGAYPITPSYAPPAFAVTPGLGSIPPMPQAMSMPFRGGGNIRGGARGNGIHIPIPLPLNPMMNVPPWMMSSFAMRPQHQQQKQQPQQRVPNPFLSIAMLDKNIPLQPLFALCEVWGQVVYIRRNFKKPTILTVKYVDPSEAQLTALCLKNTPLFGARISGRNYDVFVEKSTDPTEEGDPTDPDLMAYNFTNSRHRLKSSRCKIPPTEFLRIWNFQRAVTAEEIHRYYDSIDCQPTEVVAQDEMSFVAHFPDLATSVKALVLSHEKVCDDERSCVVFVQNEAIQPSAAAKSSEEPQPAQPETTAPAED